MLWDGVRWAEDSYRAAMKLMAAIGGYTGGGLLVQRLSDYRRGVASSEASMRGIALSNPACKPGDVRRFLPAEYFERMDAFLERLTRLAPGILCEDSVLFAPSIEWWMRRVEVRGRHLETSCPGIYVCGDGSGWSQGIVHSAATGLLVAEGISGRAINRSTMQEFLRETCASRHPLAAGACPTSGGSL